MQRVLSILILSAVPACIVADDGGFGSNGTNGNGNGGGGGGGGTTPPSTQLLDFRGVQPLAGNFPNQAGVNNHIAVGGTHEVTLLLESDGSELARPFDATTISPALLAVDAIDGPHVTLRAHGAGIDNLAISDPTSHGILDDAYYAMSDFFRAAPVGTVEAFTSPDPLVSAPRFVFAAGSPRIAIAYLNGLAPANRLVDTSATLTAPGGTQTRWDAIELADAAPGLHEIEVTIGDRATTVPVELVADADRVELMIQIAGATCFGAFHEGAFISGLAWTIALDGVEVDPALGLELGPNCVAYDGATSHELTATAGGKTLTITTP